MIFHSLEFLLIYLPITLPLFFFVNRFHPKAGALFIFLASLFFYGWWNPKYTLLLLFSIMINFFIGMTIIKARKALSATNTKYILFIGVSFNLVVLGYFKYANFFAENMNVVLGTSVHLNYIILPLGISFFTFTQIAFLVDAHNSNIKEYNFIHYGMFVTFFPHLLAGPIYHHREMMPQFAESSIYRFSSKDFAVGLTIFFIGMFKKVCIADSMALYADPFFMAAAKGGPLGFLRFHGGGYLLLIPYYLNSLIKQTILQTHHDSRLSYSSKEIFICK